MKVLYLMKKKIIFFFFLKELEYYIEFQVYIKR